VASIATWVHLFAVNQWPIRLAVVVSNVRTSVVTLSSSAMRRQATTVNVEGATAWVQHLHRLLLTHRRRTSGSNLYSGFAHQGETDLSADGAAAVYHCFIR
jgi:hypothetical protein